MAKTKEEMRKYNREYRRKWLLIPGNRERSNQLTRAWFDKNIRADNPKLKEFRQKKKAIYRKYMDRIKADPVRFAKFNQNQRDRARATAHKRLK